MARNVLTARLTRLVEEDVLEKRPYQTNPERYEYFLTQKGLDLWPVLMAYLGWGDKYCEPEKGKPRLIVHKGCGGEIDDRRICLKCGKPWRSRKQNQSRARQNHTPKKNSQPPKPEHMGMVRAGRGGAPGGNAP